MCRIVTISIFKALKHKQTSFKVTQYNRHTSCPCTATSFLTSSEFLQEKNSFGSCKIAGNVVVVGKDVARGLVEATAQMTAGAGFGVMLEKGGSSNVRSPKEEIEEMDIH